MIEDSSQMIGPFKLTFAFLQDQKKLESILLAEKEAIFGSKPSPKRTSSLSRKTNGYRPNGNTNGLKTPTPRRSSLGSATPELLTPRSYSGHNRYFGDLSRLSTSHLNFGDDSLSTFTSISGSEPESPSIGWTPYCWYFRLQMHSFLILTTLGNFITD